MLFENLVEKNRSRRTTYLIALRFHSWRAIVCKEWRGHGEGMSRAAVGEGRWRKKFSWRLREIMPSIEKVGPKNSQTTIDPNNNDFL